MSEHLQAFRMALHAEEREVGPLTIEDIDRVLAGLPRPEPAQINEMIAAANEAFQFMREWSGSAFLAGEADEAMSEDECKTELYRGLCKFGNHMTWLADELKGIRLAPPSAASPPVLVAHSDDIAVDRFATAMKAKLASKRAEGYGGWDDPGACAVEDLCRLLVEHVAKGDPVDVGNFAMMIHQRGERIVTRPASDILTWRDEGHRIVAVSQVHEVGAVFPPGGQRARWGWRIWCGPTIHPAQGHAGSEAGAKRQIEGRFRQLLEAAGLETRGRK